MYFRKRSWRKCDTFCALACLYRCVLFTFAATHRSEHPFYKSRSWTLGWAVYSASGRRGGDHLSVASRGAAALSSLRGEVMPLPTTKGGGYHKPNTICVLKPAQKSKAPCLILITVLKFKRAGPSSLVDREDRLMSKLLSSGTKRQKTSK